ncbi:hypothetical protein GCM10020216_039070 [Nonomuraea helvata]
MATRPYRGGGTINLQTRVPEELHQRYHQAARARGLSLSLYLEQLIELDPLAPPARESSDEEQALSA